MASQTFPIGLGSVSERKVRSLSEAVNFLEDDTSVESCLCFKDFSPVSKEEEAMLKRLSLAFASNSSVKMLEFSNFGINESDVAEAIQGGLSQENIVYLNFTNISTEETLTKIMCKAFQERSAPIELELDSCSSSFCKLLLEASFLHCFSLDLANLRSHELEKPLKKLFSRGSLCNLAFRKLSGLKESVFVQPSRCVSLLPGLKLLDLSETAASNYALITLCSSLEMMLSSGRSDLVDWLCLDSENIQGRLLYCWFKLL